MQKSLVHRIALALFGGLIFLSSILIAKNLAFNQTPSLKHRLFYLKRGFSEAEIKKGSFVFFTLSDTKHYAGENTIKEVVCLDGETITTIGKDYYCAGMYQGSAKDFTLKGEPLENFFFSGVIPQGYVFVIGHHRDSYDSRYFGFIKKNSIKAIAYPLL